MQSGCGVGSGMMGEAGVGAEWVWMGGGRRVDGAWSLSGVWVQVQTELGWVWVVRSGYEVGKVWDVSQIHIEGSWYRGPEQSVYALLM